MGEAAGKNLRRTGFGPNPKGGTGTRKVLRY
jgi:hypothetical protein